MSPSPFFLLSPWPQSTELPLLYELIGAVPKERRVTFCLLNSKLGVTRHEHKYDLGHQRPSWDLQALQRVLRHSAGLTVRLWGTQTRQEQWVRILYCPWLFPISAVLFGRFRGVLERLGGAVVHLEKVWGFSFDWSLLGVGGQQDST